jgi:MFS family permease
MTLFFTVIGNFPGTYIMKNKILGPKMILLIGASSGICAFAVCSSFEKFSWFEYSYPCLLGFACGFVSQTMMYVSWMYWPNNRTAIASLFNSVIGLGAGICTFFSTLLNNPDNELPTKGPKPFSQDVAENFPISLRWYALIFTITFIIAIILLPKIPDE